MGDGKKLKLYFITKTGCGFKENSDALEWIISLDSSKSAITYFFAFKCTEMA